MVKIILDAEDAVFGRVGTVAAKTVLKGDEVAIINIEKAIITGSRPDIMKKVIRLKKIGGSSQKGAHYSKLADKFAKRKIRGMLPWDRMKGREAFRRLRCYIGNGPLSEVELKTARKMRAEDMPLKYLTIKQIVEVL